MWDRTLRQLHTIRAALMTGLDHGEMRQAVWERQYWTRADEQRDHVLVFEEVQKRQLNIKEDLQRADGRGAPRLRRLWRRFAPSREAAGAGRRGWGVVSTSTTL